MDLSESLTMSFSAREIVILDMFFRQSLSKLGNGTFRDEVQAIKERFDKAVLRSQISGVGDKPF